MKELKEEMETKIGRILTENCIRTLFKTEECSGNPYENLVQYKICQSPLKTTELYLVFAKLRKLFNGKFTVVFLFIPDAHGQIMQLIIGEPDAIKKERYGENTNDFVVKIC